MHVTLYFPVTGTHTNFRLFPSVMLGICWEQTEERKGSRTHLGSSQSGRDDGEVVESAIRRVWLHPFFGPLQHACLSIVIGETY
jgi:hypothetical protein